LMEAIAVSTHWKTSMHVGALVTLVAAVHYFYIREYWVIIHNSPILYRYIDWSITVPLQMIEFYLILSAVKPDIDSGMFWRLMIGTVLMLAFGYGGEAHLLGPVGAWVGFLCGLSGWAYILYEIFSGEAGEIASSGKVNKYVEASFKTMRFIVTVGWSIYPLGYYFGYLMGSVSAQALNLIYNLADLVNKIGFCLAIWASAKQSTLEDATMEEGGLFQPGSLGVFADWYTGEVKSVVSGGQGEAAGVKPGMRITHVNGVSYTEKLVNEAMAGNVPFTAAFSHDE